MSEHVPFRIWGSGLEEQSVQQMRNACSLPVAAAGALMPDAHVGFGVPIGGVVATRGAVIPYAVGVDIACRMKLSVLDIPLKDLEHDHTRKMLAKAIEEETRFGVGVEFRGGDIREHEVMSRDWSVSGVTLYNKRKAQGQLGTSGSGNHFVEWGLLTVNEDSGKHGVSPHGEATGGSGWDWNLAPGRYVALLSHSGSRGTGAAVCDYYSKLAKAKHPELPRELAQLAWLDMAGPEGQEYWAAMNLMGEYAAANHACIHRAIAKHLKVDVLAGVENHHNFAWKETHTIDGREEEVYVHRKGATPAGAGVLGVIPGSMASPGFVVRGLGSAASLNSASHGAGRVMSRTKARDSFAWGNVRRELEEKGVWVLSAGIDEVPGVYKDIEQVMAAQTDLVEVLARFDPRIVKMAPEGEKAED
ncbi:RNA-splicing ligase RtcB [Phycisphaerales bacterium]|nr:RNA-splicing ligase RtcB [Phycisphaerales bacterium]